MKRLLAITNRKRTVSEADFETQERPAEIIVPHFHFTAGIQFADGGTISVRDAVLTTIERFNQQYPDRDLDMVDIELFIMGLEESDPSKVYEYLLHEHLQPIPTENNAFFYVFLTGIIEDGQETSDLFKDQDQARRLCEHYISAGIDFSTYRNAADFKFCVTIDSLGDLNRLRCYPYPESTLKEITLKTFYNPDTDEVIPLSQDHINALPSNLTELTIECSTIEAGLDLTRLTGLKKVTLDTLYDKKGDLQRPLTQELLDMLPDWIEELSIVDCDFTEALDFSRFQALKKVFFQEADYETLDLDLITNLPPSLTEVDLSACEIKESIFERLENLQKVNLTGCTVPAEFVWPEACQTITTINIENITFNSDFLLQIRNLKLVEIKGSEILSPERLCSIPSSVEELSLEDTVIYPNDEDEEPIPDRDLLVALTQLRRLDIQSTQGFTQEMLDGLPNKTALKKFSYTPGAGTAFDLSEFPSLA